MPLLANTFSVQIKKHISLKVSHARNETTFFPLVFLLLLLLRDILFNGPRKKIFKYGFYMFLRYI